MDGGAGADHLLMAGLGDDIYIVDMSATSSTRNRGRLQSTR